MLELGIWPSPAAASGEPEPPAVRREGIRGGGGGGGGVWEGLSEAPPPEFFSEDNVKNGNFPLEKLLRSAKVYYLHG